MSEHVLPPGQKGKQLMRTHKKFPKMVCMVLFFDIGCIFFWVLVHVLQLLLYPKLLDLFNLHPPCLTQVIRTDKIHHRYFGIQLLLQLYLPGITTPCYPSLYLNWPKVLIFLKSWNIITYESCMFIRWCRIGWTKYCVIEW